MAHTLISQTTHGTLPRVPFRVIADTVLGSTYELSLVFAGDTRTRRLNREHRGKAYVPNVLSFPLSKTSGEIYVNLKRARIEAPKYGMPYADFVAYLFIHGLFHLKGHDHGAKMERLEQITLARFGFRTPRE